LAHRGIWPGYTQLPHSTEPRAGISVSNKLKRHGSEAPSKGKTACTLHCTLLDRGGAVPVKSNLTLAYALSGLLAVLLLVPSVVGLLDGGRFLEHIGVLLE
jgi:hypothetical protein